MEARKEKDKGAKDIEVLGWSIKEPWADWTDEEIKEFFELERNK